MPETFSEDSVRLVDEGRCGRGQGEQDNIALKEGKKAYYLPVFLESRKRGRPFVILPTSAGAPPIANESSSLSHRSFAAIRRRGTRDLDEAKGRGINGPCARCATRTMRVDVQHTTAKGRS